MTDEVKPEVEKRVWINGRPNKGKINTAIMSQIPQYQGYDIDAAKLMDETLWEAGTRDDTPGFWVTVFLRVGPKTNLLVINDRTAIKEDNDTIQTHEKSSPK